MAKQCKDVKAEEKVEDFFKAQLKSFGLRYYTKTEVINEEIDTALRVAPSKSGNIGKNYPDIKMLLQSDTGRKIPVMIEAKGERNSLIKTTKDGDIELVKEFKSDSKEGAKSQHKKGDADYSTIVKYAVNGAVHYANAVINKSTYKECVAIGLNGWFTENNELETEISVYYISEENYMTPKQIGEYSDLSFLKKENLNAFIKKLDECALSEEEKEKRALKTESELDSKLKKINHIMQDTLQINVNCRVNLISGMIMAGLGATDSTGNCITSPLEPSDLKGNLGLGDNDGISFINKIDSFLSEKSLPLEKKNLIINILKGVFLDSSLYTPKNGESKLRGIYRLIYDDILPIFRSSHYLDFTGKLFNVLNTWVVVPDGDKNDVVFTPRYVTDFMAKIAAVNMNSYVWDYCAGSAGFLVSAMKLMFEDAKNRICSPNELQQKELHIKFNQLLGIEKLSDIYMLAVLNMILMKDGSANIIHKDSLTYNGTYEQGINKDKDFPADVFLLNPPYSADGKGFIFVKRALSKMKHGKAVILIQENAGSGQGLPYTKELLKNNTLVASIRMSDIFNGKAGVQTAVYVFEIGKPHDIKADVKFINFSKDGYSRQNRKKSSQEVNLKNVDHAKERYEEVIELIKYGRKALHYLTEDDYIEDTITLGGNDWTFNQHKKIDTTATEEDFKKTVADYLAWKVSNVLNSRVSRDD